MAEDNLSIIEFRLKAIEEEIRDLKGLLVSVPVINTMVTNMDKRVSACEKDIDVVKVKINNLEVAPMKNSASKWKYITDYAFKTLVAICFATVLYKIGVNS